jgi:hypothetical protein
LVGFSSTIALKQRARYAGGKYYVNLGTKGGWHDLASAINPILDSVQYKIYTWFAGLSVGYQISSSKPDWLPEWVQPIMLQLHQISILESITAWGVIMLAVERTFAAVIRFNQWRRERQLAKRRESAKQ